MDGSLLERFNAEREVANRRDQEVVAHLGLTVRRNGYHVLILKDGTPVYHWYPTKGSLYVGPSPDEQIKGRYNSLDEVAVAIEAYRRSK